MGWRSLAVALLLMLLAAFAAINWGAFTTPTSLTLGFTSVRVPLGLLMLGLCAGITLALGSLALWLHTRSLMELRRQVKAQQALRELAEKAESSRLVQLQSALEGGLERLRAQLDGVRSQLVERIDAQQQQQARQLAETANGLAAALAELDQRVSAQLPAHRDSA